MALAGNAAQNMRRHRTANGGASGSLAKKRCSKHTPLPNLRGKNFFYGKRYIILYR
jgi:hypothetical protein